MFDVEYLRKGQGVNSVKQYKREKRKHLELLFKHVDQSILKWFGHVGKMNEGKLTEWILRGEVNSAMRG